MKNCKHYGIIWFLMILLLVFIFIACDENNDDDEYIENSIILNEGGVTVYQGKGVSDSEFSYIVEQLNIVVAPGALGSEQRNNFKNNFPEVRIKKGTGISHHENVLTIGCNETAESIYIYLVVDNDLV